ncbi:MAG: FAD-dependent oxidoreductase [Bdellovibrionales bacterium]|nr:FAD-dependent oxidoreductase [Bdellovibrionales bacterium]
MKITVVGAGLAGAWTVRALLEASPDIRVCWIDRAGGPAKGSSGNRAGIFKPILTPTETPGSWLSVQAFRHLVRELEGATYARGYFSTEGLVQIPQDEAEAKKLQTALKTREWKRDMAVAISADGIREKTGHVGRFPGIFFPKGGWLSPAGWIHASFEDLKSHHEDRLIWEWNREGIDPQATMSHADAIVFCTAEDSVRLEEFRAIKTQIIRGQISIIRSAKFTVGPLPAAFHEYWIKLPTGDVMMGATHDRDDSATDPRPGDHPRLLERIGPDFLKVFEGDPHALATPVEIRAGLRFGVDTHMPKMGRLPRSSETWDCPVYALTAMGSRGILWAPLLSRILAAEILGHDKVRGTSTPHEAVQKIRTMVGFQHA